MKIVIVEDEWHARNHLQRCIERHKDAVVTGLCADGASAIETILRTRPDVLFLDIRIPDPDGFAVLRALPSHALPLVVFVTAFSDFAVQAFEVNACDYILKPFENRRVDAALDKIRSILSRHTISSELKKLSAVLNDPATASRSTVLPVKFKGKIILIPFDEIEAAVSDGDYVTIHTAKSKHSVQLTLTRLIAQLPQEFRRVHRSAIVNTSHIKELRSKFRGDYDVVLRSGRIVRMSRSFRDSFRTFIER